jgi:phosphatidylinositol-3-phosphatase
MLTRISAALVVAAALAFPQLVRAAGTPSFSHVYVIMEENSSYEDIIGNTTDAPYINHLAETEGFAANYYGVTHPSQPNYVAFTSGSFWGVNKDDSTLTFDKQNIVDQLEARGLSWATYQQGLPAVGSLVPQWPATGSGLYVKKHNPFLLYTDVMSDPARLQHVKPIEDLATDVNAGSAPNFAFIAPDQCHDMHGVSSTSAAAYGEPWCAYPADFVLSHALIRAADDYVKQLVTTITSSKGWTSDSAIVLTWDENESSGATNQNLGYASGTGCCASPPALGGGRVPAIIITNSPAHTVSLQPYNHYSLLRTIEDNFGLSCLANACDPSVKPMTDLFPPSGKAVPLAETQGFAVTFYSHNPGQGSVLFGPSCKALVETATRDIGAGTTTHTVLVQGNDMPGTIGNIGLSPGATYYYEVQTVGPTGVEIDNNGGQCYQQTISAP